MISSEHTTSQTDELETFGTEAFALRKHRKSSWLRSETGTTKIRVVLSDWSLALCNSIRVF